MEIAYVGLIEEMLREAVGSLCPRKSFLLQKESVISWDH